MNYINVSLGDTDEEKFMNIQSIKRIRNWFKKLVIFISIFAFIILLIGISNGAMEMEGLGIIGAILVLGLMLVANYYITVYIYGTIFAWGLFVIDRKKFIDEIPEPVKTEEVITAYLIGGEYYAGWLCLTDFTFLSLCICFVIGVWLGAINAILHFKECRDVEKRIKAKYMKKA